MANILIIEDDEHVACTIRATLEMAGHTCSRLPDGKNAKDLAESGRFDLILLDVMLPGEDGFAVMEQIKDAGTPVIFLTARQDVLDKVAGLKLGAEDYIVKPFEALELLARIEVVLRRYHKMEAVLSYGEILVETEKHNVTFRGDAVSLTPKEFELLVFFMRHVDMAVTREQLLQNRIELPKSPFKGVNFEVFIKFTPLTLTFRFLRSTITAKRKTKKEWVIT